MMNVCDSPECDAHTLIEAEEIEKDKKRYAAAIKAMKGMKEEKQSQMDAIESLLSGDKEKD